MQTSISGIKLGSSYTLTNPNSSEEIAVQADGHLEREVRDQFSGVQDSVSGLQDPDVQAFIKGVVEEGEYEDPIGELEDFARFEMDEIASDTLGKKWRADEAYGYNNELEWATVSLRTNGEESQSLTITDSEVSLTTSYQAKDGSIVEQSILAESYELKNGLVYFGEISESASIKA